MHSGVRARWSVDGEERMCEPHFTGTRGKGNVLPLRPCAHVREMLLEFDWVPLRNRRVCQWIYCQHTAPGPRTSKLRRCRGAQEMVGSYRPQLHMYYERSGSPPSDVDLRYDCPLLSATQDLVYEKRSSSL